MPPAVLLPVALAGAGMVAQNIQNKAAIKNNQTQQQAAVNNAQGAWGQAQQNMAPWLKPGAAPAGNTTIAPAPGNYASGGSGGTVAGAPVNIGAILQKYAGLAQPQPQQPNPQTSAIQRVMSAAMGQ